LPHTCALAVVTLGDMSTFPLSRRRALAGALLLAAALVVAGRYLAGAGASSGQARPAAQPLQAVEAAAPAALVVHVVGAVRRPGLYRLREGSRIADAVARAGGATRRADVSLVNLAAPVADGAQVVVPRRAPAGAAAAGIGGTPAAPGGPVHLNTATLEQLDELPGVGPSTAQKILDFREQHGAFTSIDELDAVPGIGPARLEQLREVAAP
jgi:competence protein ComEA